MGGAPCGGPARIIIAGAPVTVRAFRDGDDVAGVTRLLHAAYAPLAEAGMRFVASWQDDAITRARMKRGTPFLALRGGEVIGTITLYGARETGGCPWYDRDDVWSFGQFAVLPQFQGLGLGRVLLDRVEQRAREQGARHLALDTAMAARGLIQFYERLGYRHAGEADWEQTNYGSVILSKFIAEKGDRSMSRSREQELALATAAAVAAGDLLTSLATQKLDVLSETRRDIKLAADKEAERLIVDRLAPVGYAILAEEGGGHGDLSSGAPMWVVDPLDGTMNFSRGVPLCCVSIALMAGEEPLVGVIHDFNRGETFTAIAAEGAWLNGAPMRVSGVETAENAILATGMHAGRDFEPAALHDFVDDLRRFRKVRMLGSAALMLAYVAAGRVDAYSEDDIMLWDVAAGLALVRGAGGHILMETSGRHRWARRVRCAGRASIWPQ